MIIEALLLGLSTGAYCLFSCAPVVTPLFMSVEPEKKYSYRMVTLFLSGRLSGYLIFGILSGITGGLLNNSLNPKYNVIFGSVVSLIIGAILILSGLKFQLPKLSICKYLYKLTNPVKGAYIFGLFTGVNVCPPFIGAATRVINNGGIMYGLLFFLIFFIATSLYFLPYLGVSFLTKKIEPLKEIARFSMLIIGFYIFVYRGIIELLKTVI